MKHRVLRPWPALLVVLTLASSCNSDDPGGPSRSGGGSTTPLVSPVPHLLAPRDATIVGRRGNEIGVQSSYCWSSGSTTRCTDLPPLGVRGDSLPVSGDENLTVRIEASEGPASESFGLALPHRPITIHPIVPGLTSSARADVSPGLHVAKLCGTWPQHGTVCWGFLLDVS